MTVTVTCQYTGIEFEAASKRSKNHPQVSEFINAANRDGKHYHGAYGAARDIITSTGATTIEEVMEIANRQYEEWKESAKAKVNQKYAVEKERKEARREREKTNAMLRRNGYKWHKEDEESMDHLGAHAFGEMYGNRDYVWILTAPDGREVTVAEALEEIKAK